MIENKDIFDNNIPIYLQLVEKIKKDIISRKLKPGERLPSVREWSITSKVNPNTMQKALQELENQKLIYTERTNGKYVTTDENLINKLKHTNIDDKISGFLDEMKSLGLNKKDIIKYMEDK